MVDFDFDVGVGTGGFRKGCNFVLGAIALLLLAFAIYVYVTQSG